MVAELVDIEGGLNNEVAGGVLVVQLILNSLQEVLAELAHEHDVSISDLRGIVVVVVIVVVVIVVGVVVVIVLLALCLGLSHSHAERKERLAGRVVLAVGVEAVAVLAVGCEAGEAAHLLSEHVASL